MRFGSVCSGIEAASVAFEPLGWKAAWFSEIEKFPCAVLAHHYPDVPNYGDMTQIPKLMSLGLMEAPDILCGGTPCQAFSVAGKRESLNDARGNLSLTFCEIADAIDNKRKSTGLDASVIFWENVPGVLNTSDNAFGCFLGQLAGESEELQPAGKKWSNAGCVLGPKRAVAWRVLDAQYFGVAQRRRRVFVVASARDGFDPAAVLLEFEGMRRDTAPSREAGEEIAANASSGLDVSRTGTLTAGFGKLGAPEIDAYTAIPSVAGSLDTQCGGGKLTHQSVANGHVIGTITARMFNALGPRDVEEGALLPVAFPTEMSATQAATAENLSPCLSVKHTTSVSYGIPGNWIGRKPENEGNAVEPMVEVSPCQTKTDRHAVAQPIAIHPHCIGRAPNAGPQGKEYLIDGSAYCMDSRGQAQAVAQPIGVFKGGQGEKAGGIGYSEVVAPTLSSADSGSNRTPTLHVGMTVRRLTPVECERLQGFPDGYTDIKPNGKPTPDGPRYKALGNSWAVPCVGWIGKRIAEQLNANP